MMRGTRSLYLASMRVTHRSAGSLACESVETMKYLFGPRARGVPPQPVWPGVSSRHRFGALISVDRAWLIGGSLFWLLTSSLPCRRVQVDPRGKRAAVIRG